MREGIMSRATAKTATRQHQPDLVTNGRSVREAAPASRAIPEAAHSSIVPEVAAGSIPSGLPVVWDYAIPRRAERVSPAWLRHYSLSIVAADFVVATLAGLLSARVGPGQPTLWVVSAFSFAWVACLALGRVYEHRFVGNGNEEYRRLFNATIRFLAVVSTVAFATDLTSSRGLVVLGVPLAILLSLIAHYVGRQGLHALRRRGRCLQRVIMVGRERSISELIRVVKGEPQAGFVVVGVCCDRCSESHIEGVPVLGDSGSIVAALEARDADTVMLTAWSDVSQTDLRRLSWDLEGSQVTLLVAPRLTDVAGPRIHIRPVAGLPLLNVEEPQFAGVRRVLKSSIDRTCAGLALLVLGPFMVLVAALVATTSPGRVFFRQVRIGKHGTPFLMHKFRSMYVDAEERLGELSERNESGDGPLFKIRDDPRVTPIGRFIRRFSIDELPQLLDVLRGRMSLVGPRPPLSHEVDLYPVDVRRRLIVKPGITGLWQVSGRADLSWEESMRLDLHYVENWSLALDLSIILKTVLAVVRRQGAY